MNSRPMKPKIVGAVGHVSSAIRPAGTGEIVYEQLGALRSVPARSEDGAADFQTGRGFRRSLRKGHRLRAAMGRRQWSVASGQ